MSSQGNKPHTLRKFFRKHSRFLILLPVLLIGTFAIAAYGYLSYTNYQKDLVQIEQEQLLTMAETVGQSLTNYLEQECDDISFFCKMLDQDHVAPESLECRQAMEEFAGRNPGLYNSILLCRSDGTILNQWGQEMQVPVSLPEAQLKAATILGKAVGTSGWYELYVAQSIQIWSQNYFLLGAINLNHIYEVTVHPVKIGEGGYSVVKDKDLTIIMHHAQSQIGLDAIDDRIAAYPQLDLTDLSRWIDMQRSAPSGTSVIHTYVWDSPELIPLRRIVAYTTIDVLGDQWIVNSTLPFEELNGPLQLMVQRMVGMSCSMLLLLIVFGFFLNRYLIRMETQRKEITYLRRINEGMELLRSKEDELRHYQRVQSLGEMSSQIAHEFNNYLTPIMVFGEILNSDEALSEENQEYTKEILKSAERGAALSRRLLDFSRQETGMQLRSLSLTEETAKAADMVSQLAPKKVQFSCHLPEENLFFMGYNGEMEQLLMNLCSNAFHAMEDTAECRLQIVLERLADPSKLPPARMGWATLSVSDSGKGIPPELLGKIFEPFYTTKHKGKGTGLGLPVVKNAVTASGGQIQVESQAGIGTTFRLLFPLCEEGTQTGNHRELPKVSRIAIVDDDLAILHSLETDLKHRGFKAEIYANPMEILSVVQNNPERYNLILLDLDMPEMEGLEAANLLRSLTRDVHLVMMSGRETPDAQRLLQTGVIDRFISKAQLTAFLNTLQ